MYNTNDRVYVRQPLERSVHSWHWSFQPAWQLALEAAEAVKARRQDVSSRRFFSGSEGIIA